MTTLRDINSMDDLGRMLEELSAEVSRMRQGDPCDLRELQVVANELTRAELVLNDLERRGACHGKPSRTMADQCIELRSRIRTVQTALERTVRREAP